MREKMLTIAACGDIMLGRKVAKHLEGTTVHEWLKGVSDSWADADVVIGNLECPFVVTARPVDPVPGTGRTPGLILHSERKRLAELAAAGFSAVSLANNHILDCGPRGLAETVQGLDEVGIAHAGAGMNLAEALEPAFIKVGAMTVGLVAFSYGPPAGRSAAGAAPDEPHFMRRSLAAARASADIVIAALHVGLEYSDVPTVKNRAQFRFLAQEGADIVLGHHPHVLQGLEWWDKVPIAYSLGDLLFDNADPGITQGNFSRIAMALHAPEEIARDPRKFLRGAVLKLRIGNGDLAAEWVPFRRGASLRPQLSQGQNLAEDLRTLEDLSMALRDNTDPRHAMAERVYREIYWATRDSLSASQLLKLALRPRWRYVGSGMRWLSRKITHTLAMPHRL